MTIQEIICEAIAQGRVISFTYEGYARTVEPFTFGRLHNGYMALSAYQIGGYSRTRTLPPWRLYLANDMQNVTITGAASATYRSGYNPRDSRMSKIIARR